MATTTTEPARTTSQLPAYKTAAMLIGTGVGHFVAPKPFDTIVPAELPGSARFYTYASGVAEVGIGTMLLVPRTRRAGALAAAADAADTTSRNGSVYSPPTGSPGTSSTPSRKGVITMPNRVPSLPAAPR